MLSSVAPALRTFFFWLGNSGIVGVIGVFAHGSAASALAASVQRIDKRGDTKLRWVLLGDGMAMASKKRRQTMEIALHLPSCRR